MTKFIKLELETNEGSNIKINREYIKPHEEEDA